MADGQLWRLVTSLVVQDGGWAGTVFNLAELALVGVAAERLWGPRRWWVIWLVSGVGAQFWGMVVQPFGGGNSVASFGLAASVAVAALVRGRGPARLLGGLCLLGGLALLAAGDVHGGAVVLGAATGAVLVRSSRSGAAAEEHRRAG
jgi:membrane associated rhomboid family serine protease